MKEILKNKTAVSIIFAIILLIAFYFMFWKNRANKKGISTTSLTDSLNILDDLEAAGIKGTRNEADYSNLADSIHNNLKFSAISDNKAKAKETLLLMKNDYDINMLVVKFGNRKENYFGLPNGGAKPLSAFVNSNFSKKSINQINSNFASKAMTYKF